MPVIVDVFAHRESEEPAIVSIADQRNRAVWSSVVLNEFKHCLQALQISLREADVVSLGEKRRGVKQFKDESVIAGRFLVVHTISTHLLFHFLLKLGNAPSEPLLAKGCLVKEVAEEDQANDVRQQMVAVAPGVLKIAFNESAVRVQTLLEFQPELWREGRRLTEKIVPGDPVARTDCDFHRDGPVRPLAERIVVNPILDELAEFLRVLLAACNPVRLSEPPYLVKPA